MSSLTFLHAPLEIKSLTTSILFPSDAKCKGVILDTSFALTFAPFGIRYSAIGR